MSALNLDIYKGIILEHYKNPRNRGELLDGMISKRAYNPLCGDDLEIGLTIDKDKITTARFRGRACSICIASASIMTESITGKSCDETLELATQMQSWLQDKEFRIKNIKLTDSLLALGNVHQHASRKRCATLPWEALCAGVKFHK